MSQPFIGEIRIFAGNFAPVGWALCNGQLIGISQNTTLYNLIGTTYGGDGVNTFAVPNLQSRVAVDQGTLPAGHNYTMGEVGGVETVTLSTQQLPVHNHVLFATGSGETQVPTGNTIPAIATGSNLTGAINIYGPLPATRTLNTATIQNSGGNQPHSNIQPYLTLNFIISLYGVFPSQS